MLLTKESGLVLPEEILSIVQQYGQKYKDLKTPRQLKWRPHQGIVSRRMSHCPVIGQEHVFEI
jgi:hypothetical protein